MDKEFADGIIFKPPSDKAPDFVKGHISIKRKDLGNWLRNKTEDWINLDVKVSKQGKYYVEVNNWKPKAGGMKQSKAVQEEDKDIPF